MREHEELPAELKAFEAQLAALVPDDRRLDRAKLLYAAGRASAQRRGRATARVWAAAFGAMTVTTAVLAIAIATRPESSVRIVERIVRVPVADHVAAADQEPSGLNEGVPGPERSGGPELAALLLDRPLPGRTSLVAAMLLGPPEEYGSPIRRTVGPWRLADWELSDAGPDAAPPVPGGPSRELPPGEEGNELKTSRQLFEELTKAQG